MTTSPENLAAQYAQMSETELMELARSYDGLLEVAQVALRAEFARRGLEPPVVEEPEEWEFRRLVTVRRYRDLAEAYVGRSLLESRIFQPGLQMRISCGWIGSTPIWWAVCDCRSTSATKRLHGKFWKKGLQRQSRMARRWSTYSQPAQSADRMRIRWAAGQSADGHFWRSTSCRFRCHRGRLPGFARHVAHG